MSPKTLATVFEYCLDQEGTQQSLAPHYGPSSESPLETSEMSLPIRTVHGTDGTGEDVRQQEFTGNSTAKRDTGKEINGSNQQTPKEARREVLLVEDNYVNLKVRSTSRNITLSH